MCGVDEIDIGREAHLKRREATRSSVRSSCLESVPHAPKNAGLLALQFQMKYVTKCTSTRRESTVVSEKLGNAQRQAH